MVEEVVIRSERAVRPSASRRASGTSCDFVGTGLSGLALWVFGGDIPEGGMEPEALVIPATIKIENTQRYREVLWLGDLDSNQD